MELFGIVRMTGRAGEGGEFFFAGGSDFMQGACVRDVSKRSAIPLDTFLWGFEEREVFVYGGSGGVVMLGLVRDWLRRCDKLVGIDGLNVLECWHNSVFIPLITPESHNYFLQEIVKKWKMHPMCTWSVQFLNFYNIKDVFRVSAIHV